MTCPFRSSMTLRNRSWVIGRGVDTFSICSAIAFASKMPTQIGSTRWPSRSRRMMIGMLVIGSTIRPLIAISICIGIPRCATARPERRMSLNKGMGPERRCQSTTSTASPRRLFGPASTMRTGSRPLPASAGG